MMRANPHLTYIILTKRPARIKANLPPDWGHFGWGNVWLGVTVEDNTRLTRIEVLRKIPATVRFVSNEPALEAIDWADVNLDGIGWMITGGESGARAVVRPWHDAWAIAAMNSGVPAVFVKQRGVHTLTLTGEQIVISHRNLGMLPDEINLRQFPVDELVQGGGNSLDLFGQVEP